ncbi:MAG TPA: hypothetical protein DEF61_05550 [Firmicutes bacterium]|nr:hypothetical protein [Bacillota bacterium]
MIIVREVKTKKERKQFINFPLKLYKNNPYFVPPLYSDEVKALNHKSPYEKEIETKFFLCFKENNVVGRIEGIIQKQYNELKSEKRIRFTRFDCINDLEVAKSLFNAVFEFGKSKGMEICCGPLGSSDFEREGLLIDGFDQVSTFSEQYNYPYYQTLIEAIGFKKEVDWVESKLLPSIDDKKTCEKLNKISSLLLKKYDLHIASTNISSSKYLDKYCDGFFDCVDIAYSKLYGTVPFKKETRRNVIKQFKMILNPNDLVIVLDKSEKVVGIGLCLPFIGQALAKSGGKLTPLALLRLLKVIKKPKVIELALVCVLPEYLNSGITSIFLSRMLELLSSGKIDHFETNLNLETNIEVRNQWKRFNSIEHKKRRSYFISLK